MKLKAVEGIVWDLDGTLLDSFGVFEKILSEVVTQSGHTMPSREFMLKNYHGSLEETIETILGIKSVTELDDTLKTFLEIQEHHYAGDVEAHLFEDATNLARKAAARKINQIIVTNRFHIDRGVASPKHIVASTFLADCIHEVYAGDEVEFRKPDKRSLGDWMDRNMLSPSGVLVIGDQFVDAQLAVNIGSRALIINRTGEIPHLGDLALESNTGIQIVEDLHHIDFA